MSVRVSIVPHTFARRNAPGNIQAQVSTTYEAAPSGGADEAALPSLARAMATGLTPAIIHSGRTAAALLARGYPRHLIEIAIDEAERMALAGKAAHG